MTVEETAQVLAFLRAIHRDEPIDRVRVLAYHAALADLDGRDVLEAARAHVRESRFFPLPDALAMRVAQRKVGAPSIDAALREVAKQVRAVGSYGIPKWSHPAIAAAIEGAGGWQAWCSADVDQQGTQRAQFERYYLSARTEAVRAENLGSLEPLQLAVQSVTKRLTGRTDG